MVQARYDAIAEFYIQGFDSVGDPASRALLELLGPVAGLQVLDVACGHGRITRELARRGASVTGIDVSGALITRALDAEQDEQLGIRYLHGDVTTPGSLGDSSGDFDVAACNFGLSDIDDLDAAITAVGDALKPGGCFAFSIVHPCFAGSKDISGSWPASGSYYLEGRWAAQGVRSGLRRLVGASHRTLSTYLATLRRHGLWLDELAEPLPAPDWDPAHDADRQPVFLVGRCIKLPASPSVLVHNSGLGEARYPSSARGRIANEQNVAQLRFHVDVSIGDPIWPEPAEISLPRLLGQEPIQLRGYPMEMVLAEKIVTALQRGPASTR